MSNIVLTKFPVGKTCEEPKQKSVRSVQKYIKCSYSFEMTTQAVIKARLAQSNITAPSSAVNMDLTWLRNSSYCQLISAYAAIAFH